MRLRGRREMEGLVGGSAALEMSYSATMRAGDSQLVCAESYIQRRDRRARRGLADRSVAALRKRSTLSACVVGRADRAAASGVASNVSANSALIVLWARREDEADAARPHQLQGLDDYFGVQVAAIIRTDSTRSRGPLAAALAAG